MLDPYIVKRLILIFFMTSRKPDVTQENIKYIKEIFTSIVRIDIFINVIVTSWCNINVSLLYSAKCELFDFPLCNDFGFTRTSLPKPQDCDTVECLIKVIV